MRCEGGITLTGKQISLDKLAAILQNKEKRLELFMGLYDNSAQMHWRGTLYPADEDAFCDRIVLEFWNHGQPIHIIFDE